MSSHVGRIRSRARSELFFRSYPVAPDREIRWLRSRLFLQLGNFDRAPNAFICSVLQFRLQFISASKITLKCIFHNNNSWLLSCYDNRVATPIADRVAKKPARDRSRICSGPGLLGYQAHSALRGEETDARTRSRVMELACC